MPVRPRPGTTPTPSGVVLGGVGCVCGSAWTVWLAVTADPFLLRCLAFLSAAHNRVPAVLLPFSFATAPIGPW